MAELYPESPLAGSGREVVRVFNTLKRLPDGWRAHQRLPVDGRRGPDFWVVAADGRALLVGVSSWTPHQVEAWRQPNLLSGSAVVEGPGSAEKRAVDQFLAAATPTGAVTPVPVVVFFPNLRDRMLRDRELPEHSAYTLHWLYRNHLNPATLQAWLGEHLGGALSAEEIALWRAAFTPEVVVPPAFTVRRPPDRNLQPTLLPYLLDYDQERVLKSELSLTGEAEGAMRDFGVSLVNGVSGSGKSLIVVYRAHVLRSLFPKQKILGLTHNRALIRDLRRRYELLSGGDKTVKWNTFNGWCRRHWPDTVPFPSPIKLRVRRDLIGRIRHRHLSDTALSALMLEEEIDWYKDRLLFTEADYLEADRAGRGFALTESMRRRVYGAMTAYQTELTRSGLCDWGDIPRAVWQMFQQGEMPLPRYDMVLVDEAQFFAPIWFELIRYLIRPKTGHLFLVADPSQGFLKRSQSWSSLGIDVRGHTQRLSRSYRTTQEILTFATLLYRRRLPVAKDDADAVVPDLQAMPRGALPVLIPLTSPQDEVTRVINEIRRLTAAGVPYEHILIIHAVADQFDSLLNRLRRDLGKHNISDPGDVWVPGTLRLCRLNGATGLESPIVFLTGVHDLFVREQSLRLSEDEREELVRDNTRRLYMAATRAGQRLILTYSGPVPNDLAQLIQDQCLSLAAA